MTRRRDTLGVGTRVTRAEWAAIVAAARAEGVSTANYMRRCLNAAFLESGHTDRLIHDTGPKRRDRFSEADHQRMREWHEAGMSYAAIARRLGCHRMTVYKWRDRGTAPVNKRGKAMDG